MATAAAASEANEEAPPVVDQDNEPVDFVAEAKRMGWTDKEDFKGDPAHHIDAETFYKRGQEMMPILKAQNKALVKRLDAAERSAKQAAEFFSKAEERAYTRALEDIRAKQEKAVEEGDVEAHRAASKELDKLEKPQAAPTTAPDAEARADEFADWGKANKWYATNTIMQSYADSQAELIAKKKGGILDRADLDAVSEKVKDKFADDFPEAFEEPAKPKLRSAVEGVSTIRGRTGGKTYNDLPQEAKQMCDKWVRNGTIKSREDYVKNYPWESK